MQSIVDIIKSIESELPYVNPTQIYNEGWLTRMLMNQSVKEKIKFGGLDFKDFSKWTSEALISSPFIKTKEKREGYTHADIVFGDFIVNYKVSGKVEVEEGVKIFGVIEAKMRSSLSKGTTNFENYNQAARILACISSNTYEKNCKIYFIVVAPKIKLTKINEQIEIENLLDGIKTRFVEYDEDFKLKQNMDSLLAKATVCNVLSWNYEDWIDAIKDSASKKMLGEFYNETKKWNSVY
ncbi:hypothetical protein [Flavobacterium beibuense]|uniref:Uncharacterized protein n=1 Tax=Flavobacterium beibuense TaxID=657326 RepID=A0A444WF09_9FLAO|nr:hypothetical protein [Flavobacterium beibuense]RYJ44294.1 hypothetical protein NU09_0904 [Flavobacterium beibuense]